MSCCYSRQMHSRRVSSECQLVLQQRAATELH